MSAGLVRTQFWNVSGPNPTPRTGMTSRAESRTDVEDYLLNAQAALVAALQDPGVATGFEVSATAGAAGVTVSPGTALDAAGRVVVLAEGSAAITDPLVGAGGVQNIPTVQVTTTGVVLDTAALTGDLLLTVTWREVEETPAGLLVLRHAPWLRLVDPATFVDDGLQLPLATVVLGAGGVVDAVETGPRRLTGSPTGRLQLSRPTASPAAGALVTQSPAVELVPRTDGGLDVNLLSPSGPPRRPLSVDGASAEVQISGPLRVGGTTALAAKLTVGAGIQAAGDVTATGDVTADGDLFAAGNIRTDGDVRSSGDLTASSAALVSLAVSGVATVAGQLTTGPLSVDGSIQVNGGITLQGGVQAQGGADLRGALAVRGNAVVGAGGDAVLITRHVQGKSFANDSPDGLFLNWSTGQTVQVGGNPPASLLVTRDAFVNGRVGVKTSSPAFDLHVNGTVCAVTFCNPSDLRLKTDVTDLVDVVDRLAGMRAVTFTPIGADEDAGPDAAEPRRHAGVVAQEVMAAFPELVVPMGPDGLMAVDYAGLAGVLVGAVNELRVTNTHLAARLERLEGARTPGGEA